ncbi:dihydrofolate reductase family protein [Microbacterium sp. AZCO]|uniref:RibD family protein n=1 Tax=Microbacterium sp. AZCO TaxID=3142976 RepID=UPI0031F3764F
MTRPYVTLSCAMSLDGYLDSAAPCRLAMSNAADFDRVDQLRAESDAIMVGASTVRRDDPRLLVRSEERRLLRRAEGKPPSPAKVTITETGELSPESSFFTAGDAEKLVYCPAPRAARISRVLGGLATIVGIGPRVTMGAVLDDLEQRGIGRLMVEGGGHLHTQFLREELADELQLVVAPFFVGESRAPRFVEPGAFPWTSNHRARLADTRQIGDVVLLRYALSDRCPDTGRESGADATAGADADSGARAGAGVATGADVATAAEAATGAGAAASADASGRLPAHS